VPADGVVAVGYASPAPPVDAPVAVVDREIVDEGAIGESVTAADAIRELGDPSPPRDAVPVPVDHPPDPSEQANQSSTDQATDGHRRHQRETGRPSRSQNRPIGLRGPISARPPKRIRTPVSSR